MIQVFQSVFMSFELLMEVFCFVLNAVQNLIRRTDGQKNQDYRSNIPNKLWALVVYWDLQDPFTLSDQDSISDQRRC